MRYALNGAGPRTRPGVLLAVLGLVAVLSLGAIACGGSDESGDQRSQGQTSSEVRTKVTTRPEPARLEPVTIETPAEEEVIVAPPTEPETPRVVTFGDAEDAFNERRYEEAVEMFTQYAERQPTNPWGHYMIGLSEWKTGDLMGAESSFGRALELDPDHHKALMNLARVLMEQGRIEEARASVEKVLENDPESGAGVRLLGRVQYISGDGDGAIESYVRAITIDEEDAWSINNLALIYIRGERFSEALPALARAIELDDAQAVFMNNLGIALERNGHDDSAIEAYKNALAIEDGYDKAAVSLARLEGSGEKRVSEPVDLSALSLLFQEQVKGWRDALLAETVSEKSDTTEVGVLDAKGFPHEFEDPFDEEKDQGEDKDSSGRDR